MKRSTAVFLGICLFALQGIKAMNESHVQQHFHATDIMNFEVVTTKLKSLVSSPILQLKSAQRLIGLLATNIMQNYTALKNEAENTGQKIDMEGINALTHFEIAEIKKLANYCNQRRRNASSCPNDLATMGRAKSSLLKQTLPIAQPLDQMCLKQVAKSLITKQLIKTGNIPFLCLPEKLEYCEQVLLKQAGFPDIKTVDDANFARALLFKNELNGMVDMTLDRALFDEQYQDTGSAKAVNWGPHNKYVQNVITALKGESLDLEISEIRMKDEDLQSIVQECKKDRKPASTIFRIFQESANENDRGKSFFVSQARSNFLQAVSIEKKPDFIAPAVLKYLENLYDIAQEKLSKEKIEIKFYLELDAYVSEIESMILEDEYEDEEEAENQPFVQDDYDNTGRIHLFPQTGTTASRRPTRTADLRTLTLIDKKTAQQREEEDIAKAIALSLEQAPSLPKEETEYSSPVAQKVWNVVYKKIPASKDEQCKSIQKKFDAALQNPERKPENPVVRVMLDAVHGLQEVQKDQSIFNIQFNRHERLLVKTVENELKKSEEEESQYWDDGFMDSSGTEDDFEEDYFYEDEMSS